MEYSIDASKYFDNILGKLNKLNNKYNEEHNCCRYWQYRNHSRDRK